MFDEHAADARRLIIDSQDLSPAYERNVIVHAAFQSYLRGWATLQGSLLLAYRLLAAEHLRLVDELVAQGIPWARNDFAPLTLQSVTAVHVVLLAELCRREMQELARTISASGILRIVVPLESTP